MLRTTAVLLGLVLLGGSAADAATYGDANGDGKLDVNDVRAVMRVAGGMAPVTETMRRYADVAPVIDFEAGLFGDGRITFLDATRMSRRLNNLAESPFPAKENFYVLEIGNTFTLRKYNTSGSPTTGPGTGVPDIVQTVQEQAEDVVGGKTYKVFVVRGSDGGEQRLVTHVKDNVGAWVPYTDDQGHAALGLLRGTVGSTTATFTPPLVVLAYPVGPATTWTGRSTAPLSTPLGTVNGTINYAGSIQGPETTTVPAGTFDQSYKITLTYTATAAGFTVASGTEVYWYAPFLGPVQHAKASGAATPLVDLKLVSAGVHGVMYP